MKVTPWTDRVGPADETIEIKGADVKKIETFDNLDAAHKAIPGSAITLNDGKRICVAELPKTLGAPPTPPTI